MGRPPGQGPGPPIGGRSEPHEPPGGGGDAVGGAPGVDDERLAEADCVVILTDHPEFDYARIVEASTLVVDTRGATHRLSAPADKVVAL